MAHICHYLIKESYCPCKVGSVNKLVKQARIGLALSSNEQTVIDPTAEISDSLEAEDEQLITGPDIQPEFKLYPHQMIGIPILLLIPILAVLGLFGIRTEQIEAENDHLAVKVDYPTRFRYKQTNTIEIAITNRTQSNWDTVIVQFDRSYIDQFSEVAFTPQVSRIRDDFYEVNLTNIAANDTQYVHVAIQSQQAGKHEGRLIVEPSVGDSLELNLRTWAFP
jgi:hypothetical protein